MLWLCLKLFNLKIMGNKSTIFSTYFLPTAKVKLTFFWQESEKFISMKKLIVRITNCSEQKITF